MTNLKHIQGVKPMKILMNVSVAVVSLSLGACGGIDMYEEGTMSQKRVQVEAENFKDDLDAKNIDDAYLSDLAGHYHKYGSGPLDVVVTYDARSYSNTAMKAGDRAAYISKVLRSNGVRDLNVGVLPIKGSGETSRIIINYDGYIASAPKGCDHLLPGLDGDAVEDDRNYKMGCTIETMLARQVARPADLMGQGKVSETTDGRSSANIVDGYRTGARLESLSGEQASGD